MNGGFLIANLIFDAVRQSLGEPHGSYMIPVLGIELTTYRTLFLVSFLVQITLVPLIYFGLRDGAEATDEGVKIAPPKPQSAGTSYWNSLLRVVRDTLRETVRIFAGLWHQPGFYKFLAFLGLAAFVRLIFYQMHYTYPKFGLRELGSGAPIGRLWAVNSLLILFLVPVVGALTQKITAYRMVTVGSVIAAASVFIMALPPAWFLGLANGWLGHWLGHGFLGLDGPVNPFYVMIFLFVVWLSIGEAFFSPRLYEYAAAIAPKGQEASYMSLSYLPFFVAKSLVSPFSGLLLGWFCPAVGPRNSSMLWLIIALTTIIAPVGLILFQRVIRVHEAGRSDS
jgi:hypothetical protein